MKKSIIYLIISLIIPFSIATNYKVLFIGNSYTAVNNLPQLVADVANSAGDAITFQSNIPGGATFQMHCSNASMSYIQQGGWDYVVLQEQSQLPSFPISQVVQEVFPYAAQLNDSIEKYSPCAETVFYMTWGRETGDPQWAPISTYEGMDDSLYVRYMMMAEDNQAIVSPVGRVWRYIRTNYPSLQLYDPDGSHPSYLGSYAAACTFYTVLFRKDPALITFDGSLNPADAALVRQIVRTVVYNQLSSWFVGAYDPFASFEYVHDNGFVSITNTSQNSDHYFWNFGDGNFSNEVNPSHSYNANGTYDVMLVVSDSCDNTDTLVQSIEIELSIEEHINASSIDIYPNPVSNELKISFAEDYIYSGIKCKIFNSIGLLLYESEVNSPLEIINLQSLSNGILFVSLYDKNNILLKSTKIIKL